MAILETKRRVYFDPFLDISLLKEVFHHNPYDPSLVTGQQNRKWSIIAASLNVFGRKPLTGRAAKDRTSLLVSAFKRQEMGNLRRSGTVEEYAERERLLQEIVKMMGETPSATHSGANSAPIIIDNNQDSLLSNGYISDTRSCSLSDTKNEPLDTIRVLLPTPQTVPTAPSPIPDDVEYRTTTPTDMEQGGGPHISDGVTPSRYSWRGQGVTFMKERARYEWETKQRELELREREIEYRREERARELALEEEKLALERDRFELERVEREKRLQHEIEMERSRESVVQTLLALIPRPNQ